VCCAGIFIPSVLARQAVIYNYYTTNGVHTGGMEYLYSGTKLTEIKFFFLQGKGVLSVRESINKLTLPTNGISERSVFILKDGRFVFDGMSFSRRPPKTYARFNYTGKITYLAAPKKDNTNTADVYTFEYNEDGFPSLITYAVSNMRSTGTDAVSERREKRFTYEYGRTAEGAIDEAKGYTFIRTAAGIEQKQSVIYITIEYKERR